MNVDEFSRQVNILNQRILKLKQEIKQPTQERSSLLTDIIQDLQAAVEELSVAEEELHQQNLELAIAYQAVEQERQRYKDLFEFAPDGYLVTDINGTIQEANQPAANLLNVTQPFLIGKPLQIFIAQGDHSSFYNRFSSLNQPEQPQAWEMHLQPRDREPFIASLTISIIYDPNHQPVALRWLLRDITEQKQAEANLRQSEATNRALLEAIPDLMIRMRTDGTYLDFIPAKDFQIIMPQQNMKGQNLHDVMPAEIAQQRMHYVEQALATGKTQSYEFEILIDGTVRHQEARIAASGPDEVLVIVRDISECKRSETERTQVEEFLRQTNADLGIKVEAQTTELREVFEQLQTEIRKRQQMRIALQESEERYRSVVTALHEGIVLQDANGTIQACNASAERILGISVDQANQQTFVAPGWEIIHEDGSPYLEDMHPARVTLRTGQPCSNAIVGVHKPNRELVWLSINCQPLWREHETTPYAVVTSFFDVTEHKQIQQETRKALDKVKDLSDLKTRFISMTSHEFRTPLSTILLSAGLLENYSAQWPEDKKRKHLRRIQGSVEHMTHLLENILFIGKADAGKLEFAPASLHLEAFCQDLVEEIQLSIGHKHQIHFISHVPDCSVDLDKKLLRQILTNLLSNAIKYSPEGSEIRFELASDLETVTFQVKDQGIGIPLRDQQQLFESFHRAANVGNISGTGLGLTIAKRCVDLHGGQITFESAVNVGTTFKVAIPLRQNPQP